MSMGMFSTANCLICFIQISMELKELLSVTEYTSRMPIAERQQEGVRFLNLSCPAVSQSCMSTFLSLILMIRSPWSSPTVVCSLWWNFLWQNCRMMEVLPTLLSPMRMYFTISSQGLLFINYQLQVYNYARIQYITMLASKGKQIKDYLLGETLLALNDMHLLQGKRAGGLEVTVLVIQKKNMQQETFIAYNNLLSENQLQVHPQYIEAVQSANNIYIIVQKISKVPNGLSWGQLLPSIVDLYRKMGQFKLQQSEIFVNREGRVVYMPFYKRMQMTSKFYAQFHNKSVLGDIFSKLVPLPNKNIALDIFIRNIDSPKAAELISAAICREVGAEDRDKQSGLYPQFGEQWQEDQAIMQLMSKVKVNSAMKKQAGQQFLRLSAQREQLKEDNQIKDIIENVQSSMCKIAPGAMKRSADHSRMEVKRSRRFQKKAVQEQLRQGESTFQLRQGESTFQLYFKSYCQSLRFLKKSIKEFLSFYKNGFAGVISSYLLILVVTLRKAYMIKQLEERRDIFQLGIDVHAIPVHKYVAFLKRDLKGEARMVGEFKNMIQNCSMPVKTYSILAPYLAEDMSVIDFHQLHTFAFFFLSALLKGREAHHVHFLHVVDCMYILLHRSYQIVFFESDFPSSYSQGYFDEKIALIESLVPSWSL